MRQIEIITIEDILQKIEKSIANLRTEEQKAIMKFMLLSDEYEKISGILESLPIIQDKLQKLREDVFREMKRYERAYLNYKNGGKNETKTRKD